MTGLQWLGLAMLASPFVVGYIGVWFVDRTTAQIITGVIAFTSFLSVGAMLLAGQ